MSTQRRQSQKPWRYSFTAMVTLAVALGLASPGAQAIVSLSNSLYSDGTAGFDPNAGPGFDTGGKNGLVRTNDTFTYNVSLTTAGEESGIVITITLPQVGGKTVAVWPQLPAYCLTPGSSISVDKLTITCALKPTGQANTNTATDILLSPLVLSTVANGTVIPAPTIVVTSPQGIPASSTTPAPVTVSAAPFYDVVLQPSWQGNPKFYGYSTASGPANEDGFYSRPLIGLIAKNPNGFGNKGVEQLDPTKPVSITVDLSGMPAGTIIDNYHTGTSPYATPNATGSFPDGCGSPGGAGLPAGFGSPSPESGGLINMYDRVADGGPAASTIANAVPNGGDCAVIGTTANSVSVSITGIDTTLTRRPTVYSGTNNPIPATDWWTTNKALVLWTPSSSYPVNVVVKNPMKVGSFSGTSISGQAMQNVDTSNDGTTYDITSYNGGSAVKIFVPDSTLTAPYATTSDPAVTSDNHVNFMTPGQTVRTQVRYVNSGTFTQTNVNSCDILDRTVFDIGSNFRATVSSGSGTIQYGARAAGKSPYFASTDSANVANLRSFGVVNGTSEYTNETCQDAGIQWFSTPAAAEAAGGLVYVRATYPTLLGNTQGFMDISGLILRNTYAATISTTYPTAVTHYKGDPVAADTLIRNVARVWNTGINTVDGVKLSDHLIVVPMKTTSRVTKDILAVDGSAKLNPPSISPDALLTYQLQPRYSTTFPPQPGTFTVTDILPPNVAYVVGSARISGVNSEPQVISNSPAAGYTRLVWTYTNVSPYVGNDGVAANLAPVRFNVKVSNLAPNNSKIVNAAAVTAGNSDYEADCTYDTTTTNFGTCTKSATNSTTVQTTAGYRLQKSTPTSTIEPGQPLSFQISYASFGKPLTSTDIPDMIDVLPYNTDGVPRTDFKGRSPSSSFDTAAYQLTSVTVPTNDPGMVVYYTKAAPTSIDNDPRDSSNTIPSGSTQWCTASQLNTAGCPATVAEATAVRLHPGVTTFPADTVYTATMNMTSTASSKAGDIFNNSVGSRSMTGTLLLLEVQAQSPVKVVSSSLSGQVFLDANQNKTLEAEADSAIAGVCVTVAGTTAGGSSVTYSMLTKADGTFSFASGAANMVFTSADCTGTALPNFGGLLRGTYTLSERQPAGYTDGADYAGSAGGTVANDSISAIALGVGQAASGYVFTEKPAALNLGKKVDNAYLRVVADPADSTKLSYVPASAQLVYTLSVTNPGNGPITNVVLTDPLPAGVSFVSATLDGAALTPIKTSPLTLTLPPLAPNTTKDVLVTVKVNVTPDTNQTAVLNTASVDALGSGTVSSQEVRTDIVYTKLFKRLRNVSQGGSWATTGSGYPGDVIEYCIEFTNYGSAALNSYQVIDALPKQTTYVPGSATLAKGTITSPAGAFPTGSVAYASSTDEMVASGLTLNPGDTGNMCFGAKIK